jgi:glucose-6-phosphate dehydrogenase assembly protein OpcA
MANIVMAGSRVSTATVVAVLSRQAHAEIVETLASLASSGVRSLCISLGEGGNVQRRDENGVTIIDGLLPRYLDNAVAASRLSSLPTLAWWRADAPGVLDELARLVDRVVLDVDEPSATWSLIPSLTQHTAVGDMRWARLTRWRDLIAQFFDIPEVRAVADRLDQVELRGTDRHQLRLLGGWLAARLPAKRTVDVTIEQAGSAALESVRIRGRDETLAVKLLSGRSCLETTVHVGSRDPALRVASAGDTGSLALIAEELRVRSRDAAFEDAVRMAERL